MTMSSQLGFDYLVEAQAQKHITVNDALVLLDAAYQLRVHGNWQESLVANEGEIYVHGQNLKFYLNGGWVEVAPKIGWVAYFVQSDQQKKFDGESWQAISQSPLKKVEIRLDLSQDQSVTIPEKTIFFGVTARVEEAIIGVGVTAWSMGVADDPTRYGSGLWLGVNGWAKGLTGTPITYWNDTELLIKGQGGEISSGVLRLNIYWLQLDIPAEV